MTRRPGRPRVLLADDHTIVAEGLEGLLSDAFNLVPCDSFAHSDVFVKDRQTGAIVRGSETGGVGGNGTSDQPAISAENSRDSPRWL